MGLDKEDIQAIIAILQKGLDTEDGAQPKRKSTTSTKSKNNTIAKKKKNNNKFEQMAEFNMCKEDLEVDRKIKKPPPSARNRPFDFVKAQCRVCGAVEKVAPSLVESIDRYKCNKCATGAG